MVLAALTLQQAEAIPTLRSSAWPAVVAQHASAGASGFALEHSRRGGGVVEQLAGFAIAAIRRKCARPSVGHADVGGVKDLLAERVITQQEYLCPAGEIPRTS